MGSTSKFALPYPELTDVANVPADMRELAEQVDVTMGGGKPYCEAQATSAQAMISGGESTIVFHQATQSPAGMFTPGGTAITVPIDGLYLILMGYSWAATANLGSRILLCRVNGATLRSWNLGSGGGALLTGMLPWTRSLAAGTTVEMREYQSSGASVSTVAQSYPSLSVARIGPAL